MRTSVACPACGEETLAASARWCGACGARLDVERRDREREVAVALDDEPPAALERTQQPPNRRIALVALVALVGALVVVQAARRPDTDPRGFTGRGDPTRSGTVSLTTIEAPAALRWDVALEPVAGPIGTLGALAADADTIVVRGDAGLAVHDTADGALRWARADVSVDDPTRLFLGPPALLVPEHVVVPVADGLRAFELDSGEERWHWTGDGVPAAWAHPAGVVTITDDRRVSLVSPDGTTQWSFDSLTVLAASARSALSGGDRSLVYLTITRPAGVDLATSGGTATAYVLAVDAASGTPRFEVEVPPDQGVTRTRLTMTRDHIAAVTATDVWVWDAVKGTLLPGAPFPHDLGPPAIATPIEGDLGIGTVAGRVVRLDPVTGRVRWSVDRGQSIAALRTTEGSVVVGSIVTERAPIRPDVTAVWSWRVVTLDPATGSLRGQANLGTDSPLLPDSGTDGPLVSLNRGTIARWGAAGRATWRAPTPAPAAPAPVVADAVYVQTAAGLEVLEITDGSRRWRHAGTGGDGTWIADSVHAPVVAAETVVAVPAAIRGEGARSVLALDSLLGVLRWDRSNDRPTAAGPLTLAGDLVFLPVGSEVHGHDVQTGRRAFAARTHVPLGPLAVHPEYVVGTPVEPRDGSTGAATADVFALRRADRSVAWREALHTCTPPAIADRSVVVGAPVGVAALDLDTGRTRWVWNTSHPTCLEPAVAQGTVATLDGDRTLVGLRLDDGQERWSSPLPAAVAAAPTIAGDEVLVPLLSGDVVAVGLDDGEQRWTLPTGGIPATSVVVADGGILVLDRDGHLRLFGG